MWQEGERERLQVERWHLLRARVLNTVGNLGNYRQFREAGATCVRPGWWEVGSRVEGLSLEFMTPKACQLLSESDERYGSIPRKMFPQDFAHHFRDSGQGPQPKGKLRGLFLPCSGLHTRPWP